MCRPAQRAMPTDFFRVRPFIFRVALFIEGLESCLRANGKLLHLLAKFANVSRSSEVEALFERVAHTRAISKNFFGPLIFFRTVDFLDR